MPETNNGEKKTEWALDWVQTNIFKLYSGSIRPAFRVCRVKINKILFSFLFVAKTLDCASYIKQCRGF